MKIFSKNLYPWIDLRQFNFAFFMLLFLIFFILIFKFIPGPLRYNQIINQRISTTLFYFFKYIFVEKEEENEDAKAKK